MWATAAHAGQVEVILRDAERFYPSQFSEAMRRIMPLGAAALPELLELAAQTEDQHRLFAICEAVQRLDIADASIADALTPKLRHPKWVVRSTCGSAIADTLPQGADNRIIVDLAMSDPECSVRMNIAMALDVNPPCAAWLPMAWSEDRCNAVAGTYGIAHCPGGDSALLGLARGAPVAQAREAALSAARELPPNPEGLETYRAVVDAAKRDNALAFAAELLGRVGDASDLPRLQNLVDTDPFGGRGVHANRAREAMAAIRGRQ
ncbi:MAG: hypothetical protein KC621_12500 [Myxococcales bacterium]|nr:hypothetical protein [Myxococcales bacterium]